MYRVVVGSDADFSEVYSAYIFRVKMLKTESYVLFYNVSPDLVWGYRSLLKP
jgi:hypothetical protein